MEEWEDFVECFFVVDEVWDLCLILYGVGVEVCVGEDCFFWYVCGVVCVL